MYNGVKITRRCKDEKIVINIDNYLFEFYRKIGQQAGGIPVEKVIADSLFKFAGEVSEKVKYKVDNKNNIL